MSDTEWIRYHTRLSLQRLLPRLKREFSNWVETEEWQEFENRLHRQWGRLFDLLVRLYGNHYDFFYYLEQLLLNAARSWLERSASLKILDRARDADPLWYMSQQMVGSVVYIDLFSENIARMHQHIPYFKQMGLSYLHLMPPFLAPEGKSDGGYAVSSYRYLKPSLGTIEELSELAEALQKEGISLVLDFVFNHTSDEHEWAQKARAGDLFYQSFYHIFSDRELPDQYEQHLRDIFPELRRGSFTWNEEMERWVWTTFNSFQWDLNYANPAVFCAMAEEMLFLANTGVEVLRLDAVAFIWKRLGTDCENQPEAHRIIQAFNAVARIAAPALCFKSEAIVHPDEVIRYISPKECQLSYNPLLMALLWEALATREVKLLERALSRRTRIPPGCAWVNYLRCHDDIGWTFDDGDAWQVGLDPAAHRRFLNDFYTGRFRGSFARGVPFQYNPANGDQRVSGTLASLAGLEQGVQKQDPTLIDMAMRRITMLRSVILSIGGIPLIYLGEEWGALNDYAYVADPAKADDSRWIHRSRAVWEPPESWEDPSRLDRQIFEQTLQLIRLRKQQPALWGCAMEVVPTENPHLFGYVRQGGGQRLLIVVNFSEHDCQMNEDLLRVHGLGYHFVDKITDTPHTADTPLFLGPYQFVWLETRHRFG